MKTKKERTISARKSANDRWSDYREYLINEIRKLATKSQLDFFLAVAPFSKPGAYGKWQDAIFELRKRNEFTNTK